MIPVDQPTPTLYFNQGCSKARAAKALLEDAGIGFATVAYLETPPSRSDLERLVRCLIGDPAALVRRDPSFDALGIDPQDLADPAVVVDVLVTNPALLERPVFVVGNRAVIGRPPERVLELL